MKITKIHLEAHPLFSTMDINCTGPDGKPLDTIVFAGVNGTGKTTLLFSILRFLLLEQVEEESTIELVENKLLGEPKIIFIKKKDKGYHQTVNEKFRATAYYTIFSEIIESERPKVIYMPTEINFEKLETHTLSFSTDYGFKKIIDQKMIELIPSFIATTVNNEVYKYPDLPAKDAIEKVCNEINSLFDILEVDARMVGLNPEGEKLPIFKNSAGKVFNINELSSGEKQLFVRAMALRMLNANNSIILIDEPEISMHPGWQQRIVKVYEKIGNNNQVIIATHSPHVVASVPKESVKLLKRVNGKITVVEYDQINGSYGLPVDIVLKELMELETVRDPEVDKQIRELWDMLHQKQHETKEFNGKYQQLEKLLGSEDEDLLLMRIEIAKLKAEKGKSNAGNQKG